MGNGASFTIVVDGGASAPLTVTAGRTVTGRVVAVVSTRLSARDVQVSFVGLEKTSVRYTQTVHSGKNTRRVTRHAYGSRTMIQARVPVGDVSTFIRNGSVEPGNYALPFEIEIPDYLPSSMNIGHGGDSASISYSIQAELTGSGTFTNYQCTRLVQVQGRAPPPAEPIPFEGPPTTVPITGCCCSAQGSVTFGATASTTVVSRGHGTVVIHMACRNDSRETVERVQISLQEVWRWTAGSHAHRSTHTLQTVPFRSSRWDASVANGQDVPPLSRSVSERNHLYDDMKAGKHAVSVNMPAGARLTYSSALLTISHRLVLEIQTRNCVNSPSIVIPIQCVESGRLEGPALESTAGPVSTLPATAPTAPYENDVVLPVDFMDTVVEAELVVVPATDMVSGGTAVHGDQPDVIPLVPATLYDPNVERPVTFSALLQEMHDTLSDLDLLQAKIQDPAWHAVLAAVTADQLGQVIQQVELDFDHTAVAALIASQVGYRHFTCAHVVAALRQSADWNRSTLVEKLLPLCGDRHTNYVLIRNELTDWEKTLTESAFQQALAN